MTESHRQEAEPFLQAIAERPGDAIPRLVFADWLEERGYHREAAGQRWAAANEKTPYHSARGYVWGHIWGPTMPRTQHELPLPFRKLDPTIVCYQPTAVDAERKYLAVCARLAWHESSGAPVL